MRTDEEVAAGVGGSKEGESISWVKICRLLQHACMIVYQQGGMAEGGTDVICARIC